ncbi:MAG TPA: hypothetical protein DCS63_02480 [Elusimicrobia bacterium]|nr:hypothetical protein [Elusimicrobiota bacterium]
MDVKIRNSGADAGITIVEVSGRVDKFTAPILGEELEVLFRVGRGKIVVDMINAEAISNEGLLVLLAMHKSAVAYQCNFGLVRVPLCIQEVFDFAGLSGVFRTYRTEQEAVTAFSGGLNPDGAGKVVLEVIRADEKAFRKVELARGKVYRIGRLKENEICIEDTALSRYHARIFFEGNDVIIEDMNSANGTFLAALRGGGARKITRHVLKDGDRIELGESMLSVRKEQ